MNKRVFVLIIVLMSISLIGIISVQVFWIKNTIEMTENQFEIDVKSALRQVSSNISDREYLEMYRMVTPFLDSRENIVDSEIKTFLYQQIDTIHQETFEYTQTTLEENYRFPTEFFDNDTIDFTKIYSKEEITIVKNKVSNNGDLAEIIPMEQFKRSGRLTDIENARFKNILDVIASRLPIHSRVSNTELNLNLTDEFGERGLNTRFKYGVYNNNLATKLKSGYFRLDAGKTYKVPLFVDSNGKSEYQLYVSFPDKKGFLIAGIGKILGLSALFTLVIIVVFIGSLHQMIKQKQISEIKTDFINNMTHEFKTPLATINLALDAIKNPKVINDSEKVLRYCKMIRDENKRMHAQVENVLRISQLEKNQLDVSKDKQDFNEPLEEAIEHVNLLVESRSGYIKMHLDAGLTTILGNKFHLTNVIVNMLENAIKYSPESPQIDIYTENTTKFIVLKIKDQGMGMTKNVQKNIFNKFYREEKGNVHNVKGHGLGLAYVKKIVEHHHGTVHVESEKGKGSTFIMKLPLI